MPSGVGDSRKFNEAWTRYHSKRPSKTIDTGHRNHFHYKWNRIPSVRENARLQSFPDEFVFMGVSQKGRAFRTHSFFEEKSKKGVQTIASIPNAA